MGGLMHFYDSHLHLGALEQGAEQEWLRQGVKGAVLSAADRSEWTHVIEAGKKNGWLRTAIGVHPWNIADTRELPAAEAMMEKLLDAPENRIAAIGEIGMDIRHQGCLDAAEQYRWCRMQCALAVKYRLPVILHVCGDWQGLARLNDEFPELRGLVHGFGGNVQIARDILRRSMLLLSFGSRILYPDSPLLPVAAEVPVGRLMVDSDAPYGKAPEQYAEWRGTPVICRQIICRIAGARRLPADTLADALAVNWHRLWEGGCRS